MSVVVVFKRGASQGLIFRSIKTSSISSIVLTGNLHADTLSRSRQSDWRPAVGRELEGASPTPKDLGTGSRDWRSAELWNVGGTWIPAGLVQGFP